MLKAKFDFDSSLDHALRLVMDLKDMSSEEEAMELALVIVRRNAAVVRMCNVPFMGDEWMKASKRIAEQDEKLAKAGLV